MSAQEHQRILETLQQEKYWIVPHVQAELGLSCADLNWSWLSHHIAQELQSGPQTLQEWLSLLRSGDPQKLALFLNHESSWFRDKPFFDLLKNNLLPQILACHPSRPIRFWSAGCAHGQEIYSLAMLIHRYFPHVWQKGVFFLGTDISESVLQVARQGIYTETELFRGLPQDDRQLYFTPIDAQSYQILPVIRDKIYFEQHALHRGWDSIPTFDIILMRNVRLYLSPELRPRIDDLVWSHLSDRGLWILGASELAFPDSKRWKKHWQGALSWFEKQNPLR